VVALIAIGAIAAAVAPRGVAGPGRSQIARVNITGLIVNNAERAKSLAELSKASYVRGVIVHVDSPGGTVAGSEQLYRALRQGAAAKPTVVGVDGLAASGGYIAAMASDHIVAQDSSVVGSIGVLAQYPNFADLLKTIGVKVEIVRSAPLKAAPSGVEP